jgi:hypothetical protein
MDWVIAAFMAASVVGAGARPSAAAVAPKPQTVTVESGTLSLRAHQ